MKRLSEINLRDPFILPVAEEGKYYMTGTVGETAWRKEASWFDVYVSTDLEFWDGPYRAFEPEEDFWAEYHFWAPEIHEYRDKYYMFASFKAEGVCRATQILVADHPKGPFKPHGDGPVTPKNWECLDGTLYVDEDGKAWLVFCQEWLQVRDGKMHALPLSPTLDAAIGEPRLLFSASEAPWGRASQDGDVYVTDGPFMHRLSNGELIMIWSTFSPSGYAIGCARSATGSVLGPWLHDPKPIYRKDGGHGMLFRTFEGELKLALHKPNKNPLERPVLLDVIEEEDRIRVVE